MLVFLYVYELIGYIGCKNAQASNNKALMHEVLLVPEMKSRDTNIPNSINAIIEQDNKTYIQSFCLYSSLFTNYLAIKVVKILKRSIITIMTFSFQWIKQKSLIDRSNAILTVDQTNILVHIL